MRLKIVEYWGSLRNEFECITDSHDDFVNVSMFALCEAAGYAGWQCTDDQARSMIGKEFDVPWGLMPNSYLCRHNPTLLIGTKWTDRGLDQRCGRCGRFCTCGDSWKPEEGTES